MSDEIEEPTSSSFWLSVIGVVGCFLIFTIVLFVAYLPARQAPVDPVANLKPEERQEKNIFTPQERKERLAALHAKEHQALTTYAWIDRDKGIVHLPIDRAVELTVQELQAQQQTAHP